MNRHFYHRSQLAPMISLSCRSVFSLDINVSATTYTTFFFKFSTHQNIDLVISQLLEIINRESMLSGLNI